MVVTGVSFGGTGGRHEMLQVRVERFQSWGRCACCALIPVKLAALLPYLVFPMPPREIIQRPLIAARGMCSGSGVLGVQQFLGGPRRGASGGQDRAGQVNFSAGVFANRGGGRQMLVRAA